MMKSFRNNIIAGLLIVLPVFLSLVILKWLFIVSTNFAANLAPDSIKTHNLWIICVRLAVFVILIAIFLLAGIIVNNVIFSKIIRLIDNLFLKIPFFNRIYRISKKISKGLFDTQKNKFKRVVFFEYPRQGIYTFGFVTAKEKGKIHDAIGDGISDVFIGTAPNPITGLLVFIKNKDIKDSDIKVVDGMKLVLSGGFLPPMNKDI